jgi:predicted Zn-dependent protease
VYLTDVAQRLLAQEARGVAPRVKVLQNPLLNAFALPNGAIFFHTGMLARMENESQLSTVLGHELVHFTHRHSVRQARNAQNQAAYTGALQIVLSTIEAALTGSQSLAPLGDLWILASTRGYSRDLETEADEQGLKAMVSAGYDPREAPAVMELLLRDLDEQRVKEPFFFGTHPQLQERISNFRRLLATQYTTQAKDAAPKPSVDDFPSRIDQLLLDNAVLDIQLGRLKTARVAVDKHLRRHANTAQAHFLLGELHRRSGTGEPYIARAIAAYEEAARQDPAHSLAHRELGFLYRAQGFSERARAEFQRYLVLSPGAADTPIVQGYLEDLDRSAQTTR